MHWNGAIFGVGLPGTGKGKSARGLPLRQKPFFWPSHCWLRVSRGRTANLRRKCNAGFRLQKRLKKFLHRTKNLGTIHSSDVETQSARCKTPTAQRAEGQLPTCHGCLLHPPPLVDLARDLTISGFFLSPINMSLFVGKPRLVVAQRAPILPMEASAFSLGYFVCARAESSTIVCMKSVFPLGQTTPPGALRFVPVNCTSLSLPYMGVTPGSHNGGPVSKTNQR
ncbi:hypothetical protein LMG1873_01484 [Achromobacter piechaudii]|uniref:Uncharacterized protein n=1 Tax=Achromobacter piechaudii TaxID=72556 RepID=A0ABM8KU91_9BURK|nr:hypothetical protein LMG1873_01484 [Achromobacter piechaudii]CAB3842883.1 hypothetical protein LMG2828_01575 [Achromobacter piechaudii]CAB3941599.1 hypothetical protein LMG6103_00138 [Achromobacter piechaudii]